MLCGVQIISQKDDHCWIGELNGLRGWFPAKFVELLDERSKSYSLAGDDSVSETVTDIVRGVYVPYHTVSCSDSRSRVAKAGRLECFYLTTSCSVPCLVIVL